MWRSKEERGALWRAPNWILSDRNLNFMILGVAIYEIRPPLHDASAFRHVLCVIVGSDGLIGFFVR